MNKLSALIIKLCDNIIEFYIFMIKEAQKLLENFTQNPNSKLK